MIGISKYVIGGQFLVIVLMSIAGYFYFKTTSSTIENLVADKTRLETTVQLQTSTINALRSDMERQNAESFNLQQRLVDADRSRRDLESSLRRRNLEAMARANSADLEQRINREVTTLFRDIENSTQPRNNRAAPTQNPSTLQPTNNSTPANTTVPPNFQPPPRPPREYNGGAQ